VSHIARALGVSRPHLSSSLSAAAKTRGPYSRTDDEAVLARIRAIVDERPSYGYRRVCGLLKRETGHARVNHKRVYRIMKDADLLLSRARSHVERPHEGRVITLRSDMRWCSDMFEIRCWNGERVHVAFSLDCCDREAIAWVAKPHHLDGTDVCDLMAQTVDARFSDDRTPFPVEWLSDNGPPYTAGTTRAFGSSCGLLVRNTPAYSPESNGMAESFVKTFKRDYVYLNDVSDAETVLKQLPAWFEDYDEVAPHKGLKMNSPRMFRAQQQE